MGCFVASRTGGHLKTLGEGTDLLTVLDFKVSEAREEDLKPKLDLTLSCKELTAKNIGCILFYQLREKWIKKGQTEPILNSNNPQFTTTLCIDYCFEERQKLKVEIYDITKAKEGDGIRQGLIYDTEEFLGVVEFYVHEIVKAIELPRTINRPLTDPMGKGKKLGELRVMGKEKKQESTDITHHEFSIRGMREARILYRIYREDKSGFKMVFESDIAEKEKGRHEFPMGDIAAYTLMKDIPDLPLKLHVFEYKETGFHIPLAGTTFTYQQLNKGMPLINLRTSGEKPKNYGKLEVVEIQYEQRYSFLDYVFSGLDINLIIGIDLGLSNGNPKDKDSLHFFNYTQNQYVKAITSVGAILENYASSGNIPVLGFGGGLPSIFENQQDLIALNGNIFHPEVNGIMGAINAYKRTLKQVELGKKSNFNAVAHFVNELASHEIKKEGKINKYYILMLITDGVIDDFQKTVDELVEASQYPVSVVIVGVGDKDHTMMEDLDADEVPLYSEKLGKQMEREIVRFVALKEFENDSHGLAHSTLEEVPKQIQSYFADKGMTPEDLKKAADKKYKTPNFYEDQINEFSERMVKRGVKKEQSKKLIEAGIPTKDEKVFIKWSAHDVIDMYNNPLLEHQKK